MDRLKDMEWAPSPRRRLAIVIGGATVTWLVIASLAAIMLTTLA